MIAICYLRVSTREQGDSRLGLEAQSEVCQRACKSRDWLTYEAIEIASGSSMKHRPILTESLQRLSDGRAGALVVSRLDRLSRSVLDFSKMLEKAQKEGWTLVVVEGGFDLGDPAGRAMAGMLAVFAQYERELISQRTKDALASAARRGIRVGRPREIDPKVESEIKAMDRDGCSYADIALALNFDGIPSPRGGAWSRKVVRDVALR